MPFAQNILNTDSLEPTSLNGREMLRIVFRRISQKSSHRYRRILKGSLHQD